MIRILKNFILEFQKDEVDHLCENLSVLSKIVDNPDLNKKTHPKNKVLQKLGSGKVVFKLSGKTFYTKSIKGSVFIFRSN